MLRRCLFQRVRYTTGANGKWNNAAWEKEKAKNEYNHSSDTYEGKRMEIPPHTIAEMEEMSGYSHTQWGEINKKEEEG